MSSVVDLVHEDDLEGLEAWTPMEAHQRMRSVSRDLMELAKERRAVGDELPSLEAEYKRQHARARIASVEQALSGGVKLPSAHHDSVADLAADEAFFDFAMARERKLSINQAISAKTAVLEILRSINRDHRMERPA